MLKIDFIMFCVNLDIVTGKQSEPSVYWVGVKDTSLQVQKMSPQVEGWGILQKVPKDFKEQAAWQT